MNAEDRALLLRAVQYHDVQAFSRFDSSFFEEDILLTDESSGAQLPLLAMGIREACTRRAGRMEIPYEWDDFLTFLVTHCHLDVNKPFEIRGRPSDISSKFPYTHKFQQEHSSVTHPIIDPSCLIHTNAFSWAFYTSLQKRKYIRGDYLSCIITLIYLGANVNDPFLLQISHGHMDPEGDLKWNALNGHSFLHLALESGSDSLLDHLLEKKAKFNLAHDRGSLAKAIANVKDIPPEWFDLNYDIYYIFRHLKTYFESGHLDAADRQVLRSADPTNGNTPFHYLALLEDLRRSQFYVDFLLEIFVNPWARNHAGLTALQVLESTIMTSETPNKQALRKHIQDAMERWYDLVMRTMVTHEALQARRMPLEVQEELARSVSGTFPMDGRMSQAASMKARIMASRRKGP